MKATKGDSSIVTMPDIAVMYVAGQRGTPFNEQAPDSFSRLEAKLSSLKGRKFYGAVIGDEYRACTALEPTDNVASLPHPTWTLPGGRYVRRLIADWENNRHLIGPTFADLRSRKDMDSSRPCIEFYRSQRELFVLVPTRQPEVAGLSGQCSNPR